MQTAIQQIAIRCGTEHLNNRYLDPAISLALASLWKLALQSLKIPGSLPYNVYKVRWLCVSTYLPDYEKERRHATDFRAPARRAANVEEIQMTSRLPPSEGVQIYPLHQLIYKLIRNEDDPHLHASIEFHNRKSLYRWARGRKFSHWFSEADIKDIAQETWTKVAKPGSNFVTSGTPDEQEKEARGWVWRIVHNTAVDHYRKIAERIAKEHFPPDDPENPDNPIEQIADPEAHLFDGRSAEITKEEYLALMISTLTERELQIAMKYLMKVPNIQIAQEFGLSPGRISQILGTEIPDKLHPSLRDYLNGKADEHDRT